MMYRMMVMALPWAELVGLLVAVQLCLLCGTTTAQLPSWTQPIPDPLKPHGGVPLAANATHARLYLATKEIGTYNMAPMFDYLNGVFLAYWKNSPTDEDQAGQRVLYSQSVDGGVTWSPTNGSNILFPNMSTTANPVALFAEPVLHISSRFYAAASPSQFCIYPDPFQSTLLLRQVLPGTFKFGSIFWAASTIPAGFEEASRINGILTLKQMDATTQADIATLNNTASLPCASPSSGSLKCEAVVNGAPAEWTENNELTHYKVPKSTADVILFRSPYHPPNYGLHLHAATRPDPSSPWSPMNLTNIPDDCANLNAGPLPGGRVYLLSNAMPNANRDPLFVSTTVDGLHFNATTALTTCTLPFYKGPGQPFGCLYRFPGGAKQGGCQYPQGMSLTAPGVEGFWAIFSLNKEDIWVVHAPFSSLA